MNNLKSSIFNINLDVDEQHYIYNTSSNTLIQVDKDLLDFMDNDEIAFLKSNKFLVEKHDDEILLLNKEVDDNINALKDRLDLTIILTETCNFQCVYCYQSKISRIFTKKDANNLLKKIEELYKNGLRTMQIHYFGGEPLLNFDILEYIDSKIKELSSVYNVKYIKHITTNGSLLTKEILDKINFDLIQLTFDGNENWHQKLKISNSFSYRQLLDLAKLIMSDSQSNLSIRFNICKENKDSFLETLETLLSYPSFDSKRVRFAFNPMRNFTNSKHFTELTPEEFSQIDWTLRKFLQKHGIKLFLPAAIKQPCKFISGNAICVGHELKTYFCTSCFNNGISSFPTDHVPLSTNYHYNFKEKCKKCSVLPLCLNACAMLDPNKNACISEKYILKDILTDFIKNPSNWKTHA